MTPGLAMLFQTLDVLSTTISPLTGYIVAQIGNVVTSQPSGDVSEWWQHVGYASRPRKPTPGKQSAQVFVVQKSDHDAILGSRDARTASVYATLDHGETAVFASDGPAVIFLRKDGTIEITGGTVKIGDATAESLTYAAKFQALCDSLAKVIATNCVNGSPLTGNTVFQTEVANIKADSGTTKAMGK